MSKYYEIHAEAYSALSKYPRYDENIELLVTEIHKQLGSPIPDILKDIKKLLRKRLKVLNSKTDNWYGRRQLQKEQRLYH